MSVWVIRSAGMQKERGQNDVGFAKMEYFHAAGKKKNFPVPTWKLRSKVTGDIHQIQIGMAFSIFELRRTIVEVIHITPKDSHRPRAAA